MKPTKRKAPRFQRDTEFFNHIIDMGKIRDSHYLLVKLKARDRKYLEGFRKHESPKVVKNTDKYFRSMIAIHTKAVFVMQTAMILEERKMASPSLINAVFNDMAKSMHNHVKAITKYYKKLCDIYDRKTKKRK